MPTRCPITGLPLEITRLECPESGVAIEGRFEVNEFASLESEHLELLRLFIKLEGNLKEAESILGLSYPSLRLRFDALLEELGYSQQDQATQKRYDQRHLILNRLKKGELSVQEAAKHLKKLH